MTAQTHMKMKNNDIWKRDNCYEIKDIFNSLRKLHLRVGDFQISREFRCIRCVHLKSFSYWIRLWSPIISWQLCIDIALSMAMQSKERLPEEIVQCEIKKDFEKKRSIKNRKFKNEKFRNSLSWAGGGRWRMDMPGWSR